MSNQTRIIMGGFMGNVVEAYDIALCYFLSSELSRVIIGDSEGNPTIMLTLIFLAYLAKPLGAFLLGLFSDIYGRKNVLMVSILIMGSSTACIGLIPNYQQIGLIAPGLLLTLRLVQSMALGSEFLNSASFLVESGDEKKRGFRGCWPSVGVKAGYLIACLIVEAIRMLNLHFPQQDWFWRIPFLLAAITSLVGYMIRATLPESLAYILYYAERKKPNTREICRQSLEFLRKSPFLFNYAFFASFLSVATGFFFYLYIPLHAVQYSQLSRDFIILSTTLSLAFVTLLIPFFGWLSDYKDRLGMLAWATAGLFLTAYPFMQAVNYGTAHWFLTMQLVISIPCACYYSVSSVLLTELFPLQIRCTALSIVFSIAASLAAGVPPLLADYLARSTGQPNSPFLIMSVLAGIVLINLSLLAKNYRLGKNHYTTITLESESELTPIYYFKKQAAEENLN